MTKDLKNKNEMSHKNFAFDLKSVKEETVDGQEFVVIKGYGSIYGNVDLGGDIVMKGAFDNSLKERMPKFFINHDSWNVIGVWDVAKSDDKGLYLEGRIPNTKQNETMIALLKMNAYGGLSIGYGVKEAEWDEDNYIIKEVTLWEVSLVSLPMNEKATISSVKSIENDEIRDCKSIKDLSGLLKSKGFSNTNINTLFSKVKEFSRNEEKTKCRNDININDAFSFKKEEKGLNELFKL